MINDIFSIVTMAFLSDTDLWPQGQDDYLTA